MTFKGRGIALASILKIKLTDSYHRQSACYPNTATDASLSPSYEPDVNE